eukprot:CAMPEP_0204827428 /NCGR_PEP_ID=MMETSP1346-20131115/4888_1 /ASSEMBLY_ACC=CAM_ASM_000771 /TAXON_ID=215587 /ORGANISM="Aplanochytrium stocchinoi, Strain GSBS06" /LENGTH=65 /DNA_ID=CAMNT_0051955845 /DNA_START=329 /DNA_END=526 /DNA_ORIENTATION=+
MKIVLKYLRVKLVSVYLTGVVIDARKKIATMELGENLVSVSVMEEGNYATITNAPQQLEGILIFA